MRMMEQQLLGIKWAGCQERSERSLGKCDWYPPNGQQHTTAKKNRLLLSSFVFFERKYCTGFRMYHVPRLLTMRDFSDGAGERERERELMWLFVCFFMWTSCGSYLQTFDLKIIFANMFPLFSSYGCNWSEMNQPTPAAPLRAGVESHIFNTVGSGVAWKDVVAEVRSLMLQLMIAKWQIMAKLWPNHAFLRYFVC